jgi:Family of unknown function (DUF6677)
MSGPSPMVVWLAAWIVPGAGHALVGQMQKAVILFVILVGMFAMGLAFGGRLFPFQTSDLLLLLAALSEWALGLPRAAGGVLGLGKGHVTSVTYEYGNTFLIVAGLLNVIAAFNAYDVATGRLPARSEAR